jgi:hypothetical protein
LEHGLPLSHANDAPAEISLVIQTGKFPGKRNAMKIKMTNLAIAAFAFACLLATGTAHAQLASVLPNTPAPIVMQDHVQHASQHAMGSETTLLSTSTYLYAKGEVPLSELGSPIYEVPLGDIARAYREGHALAPKAAKIMEQQGN